MPMASQNIICAFCGAEDTKLQSCSRCKITCYCSKECQRSHWKVHKANCKPAIFEKQPKQETDVSVAKAKFPQPVKKDRESLAVFVCNELDSNGFCVIDELLTNETAREILAEVKSLHGSGIFEDGQLSGGVTASEKGEKYTEKRIRGDKLTWVEGYEPGVSHIGDLLQHYDSIVMECNAKDNKLGGYDIRGRTKAMVACYPGGGTGYVRHVDNPDGDGRCLTVLFYLNEGWSEKDGGMLRIYRGSSVIDVEPVFNRLLLFWSDGRTPHEVLPAYSSRFAISVWYFDQEERRRAKELQKYKLMGEFGTEVAMKDVKEKKLERDLAQMKLEEQSEQLVKKMLSEEELDAMAVLIKQAPNSTDVLQSYGIASSIQGALLRVLEKRTEKLV